MTKCGRRRVPIGLASALLLIALVVPAAPLAAVLCTVPGDYPTIGEAAAAASCSEVSVLAGTFVENLQVERSLSLHGAGAASTTLHGRLWVRGAGVDVALNDLSIDTGGCFAVGLEVSDGGGTQTSTGTVEVRDTGGATDCPIFRDGFEVGTTGRWSVIVP
jgi:hypothetical protein